MPPDIPTSEDDIDRFTDDDRNAIMLAVTDAVNDWAEGFGAVPPTPDEVTDFRTGLGVVAATRVMVPRYGDLRRSELRWIDKAIITALDAVGVLATR